MAIYNYFMKYNMESALSGKLLELQNLPLMTEEDFGKQSIEVVFEGKTPYEFSGEDKNDIIVASKIETTCFTESSQLCKENMKNFDIIYGDPKSLLIDNVNILHPLKSKSLKRLAVRNKSERSEFEKQANRKALRGDKFPFAIDCPNLKELLLGEGTIIDPKLINTPLLEQLTLVKVNIDERFGDLLDKMPNLKDLHMWECNIPTLAKDIHKLKNLRQLYVKQMYLTKEEINSIRSMEYFKCGSFKATQNSERDRKINFQYDYNISDFTNMQHII